MASTWRRGYKRADGTWVRGHRVRGKKPKPGCQFWLIGMVGVAAVVARRKFGRPQ